MGELVRTLREWGSLGLLLLAAIDSVGLPLPAGVDAVVVLLATANPRSAWHGALAAVLGSLAGCWILFAVARKGGESYLHRYTAHPRASRFRQWFLRYGLITVFIPALVPIPLPVKVFVVSAGALGVRPVAFLAVILAARILRYFGLAYLGAQLGGHSLTWLAAHVWHMAALAAALLVALYLLARALDRASVDARPRG